MADTLDALINRIHVICFDNPSTSATDWRERMELTLSGWHFNATKDDICTPRTARSPE